MGPDSCTQTLSQGAARLLSCKGFWPHSAPVRFVIAFRLLAVGRVPSRLARRKERHRTYVLRRVVPRSMLAEPLACAEVCKLFMAKETISCQLRDDLSLR